MLNTISERTDGFSEKLVTINNLSKIYDNGTVALQNVNLDIHEGEIVSFVGPSGCGKSSIFKLIAGLGSPSIGHLDIAGQSPQGARKKNELAFVFQEHTLLPWLSVYSNVALPLTLRGIRKEKQKDQVEKILELVGLQEYARALPRQLSGGMKMRVSIARALIANPRLLLMDEPFGALDEITRQTLQDELLSIWQKDKRMTILFVTHNVFESVYLSNRVVVMSPRPGKISADLKIEFPGNRSEELRSTTLFGNYVSQVSHYLKH